MIHDENGRGNDIECEDNVDMQKIDEEDSEGK